MKHPSTLVPGNPNSWLLWGSVLYALGGCGGTIGDPNITVTTLQLAADEHGALLAQGCVAKFGKSGCSPYPNDFGCDAMEVDISASGTTYLRCFKAQRVIQTGLATLADGSPFVCKAAAGNACQVCFDLYGNPVYDSCNRGTALYRSTQGGWNASPDGYAGAPLGQAPPQGPGDKQLPTSQPPEVTPADSTTSPTPPAETPPATEAGECHPERALDNYAAELNAILATEGLGFSWSPTFIANRDAKNAAFLKAGNRDLCEKWLSSESVLTRCWNQNDATKCHCQTGQSPGDDGSRYNQTCRCARINVFALRAACQQIPAFCANYDSHVANLALAYGSATQWLFHGTYGENNYYGTTVAKGGQPGEVFIPGETPNSMAPRCLASPLVFDLGDNGVAPSAPERGVHFNLNAHGKLKTAWIAGDDALLVLDRDGNGTIDDGRELFGSATQVDGVPAEDGFAALAVLDQAGHGGNGNGLIESEDLLFRELRLWRDTNRDGISQASELTSLVAAGIEAIELRVQRRELRDQHGNDLGLQGSFVRQDGRQGLIVDVFFIVDR